MKKKIVSFLIVLSVFLYGCTEEPEPQPMFNWEDAEETQQSLAKLYGQESVEASVGVPTFNMTRSDQFLMDMYYIADGRLEVAADSKGRVANILVNGVNVESLYDTLEWCGIQPSEEISHFIDTGYTPSKAFSETYSFKYNDLGYVIGRVDYETEDLGVKYTLTIQDFDRIPE